MRLSYCPHWMNEVVDVQNAVQQGLLLMGTETLHTRAERRPLDCAQKMNVASKANKSGKVKDTEWALSIDADQLGITPHAMRAPDAL